MSTGGLIVSLLFKFLNLRTAWSTLAVTPINLESVLNMVESKLNSIAILDSGLWDWVVFSSKAYSLGMDCTSL